MSHHSHRADHSVNHHIEQVTVPHPRGEIVSEVERPLLEQSETYRNREAGAVHVVREEVDQERGVGSFQELQDRADDDFSGRFLELRGGRRESRGDDVEEGERRGY